MAQAGPLEIAREIDRRRQPQVDPRTLPIPDNDDHPGGGKCPACNRPVSIAPTESEYRGEGVIHHHWRCNACGHAWTTAVNVPT